MEGKAIKPENAWVGFQTCLYHVRRYAPPLDIERKASPRKWLGNLKRRRPLRLEQGSVVWRARIFDPHGEPQPRDETTMGAPAAWCARANRANARGIRVFYGAEDEGTAVAEVQPSLQDDVWVAQWTPVGELRLLDLTVSPQHSSADRARYYQIVSRAFAAPIRQQDEELHYVPTQYIAEVVANAGFDGLRYESAQRREGRNIVIFEPWRKLTMVSEPQCVKVNAVTYEYAPK